MSAEVARGRLAGEQGFTLLETLVALAVLGVVLATLFRLGGDALAQHHGREARLILALTAESAFNAERLERDSAADDTWPEGLTVTVEWRELDGVTGLEGLGDLPVALTSDVDWLSVQVTDADGRSFALEGAVVGSPQ